MDVCLACIVEIIGCERSSWIAWQRCSVDRVEEAIVCKKDCAVYGFDEIDFDPDSDFDPEETKAKQADALDAHSSRQ